MDVWKEYAYKQGIHSAVISYLELRKQNFYRIETTVDGKAFATARGWEDLSQLIQTYEVLGKTIDRDVIAQYIQHKMIAKDFANYLELFYKYRKDYGVEDILEGKWNTATLQKIKAAPFDEHLSVVSLLNGKASEMFQKSFLEDSYVSKVYEYLLIYKENLGSMRPEDIWHQAERDHQEQIRKELLNYTEEIVMKKAVAALEKFAKQSQDNILENNSEEQFEQVKEMFGELVQSRENLIELTSEMLTHIFDFMEAAFGESQEMVVLITELNANSYAVWFIKENGCDQYYRYNKGLLFDERQQAIVQEMDAVETLLNKQGAIS